MRKVSIVFAAVLALSGCSSLCDNSDQYVTVSTTPVQGAVCTLNNNKGTWQIPTTPCTTIVQGTYGDLVVTCQKDHLSGSVAVASSTRSVISGDIIPEVKDVDCATGAVYAYPSEITVHLKKPSHIS